MAAPDVGSTIGQYELLDKIGTGGMATVYRAHQARLDRIVAVKLMHEMFLSDDSFLARFEREARIVASLDHPNIVPMYDYDDYEGIPYLVMKFVDGHTLKRRLKKEGVLSLDEILDIVPAVADALSYAHDKGILHRDIKPSNIIIDHGGTPYLMDFGLARIAKAGESTMSADMMLGTPHYISPEQAQGLKELDARTDVYSLGALLYELVVGRVPFDGDSPFVIVHKHIYNAPMPPSQINPEIPPTVDAVIMRALAKTPDERYATPNALSDAFRQAVESSGLHALPDDRASVAVQLREEQPSPPPTHIDPDIEARFVMIPSPVSGSTPAMTGDPQSAAVASPLTSRQALLEDLIARFREAIEDVLRQMRDPNFMENLRRRAPQVAIELQAEMEETFSEEQAKRWQRGSEYRRMRAEARASRRESRRGGPPLPPSPPGIQRRVDAGHGEARLTPQTEALYAEGFRSRQAAADWSVEDAAIRRRAMRSASRVSGFMTHLGVFVVASVLLLGGARGINEFLGGVVTGVLENVEGLTIPDSLALINYVRVGLLIWAGGLINHGLKTFYHTGGRMQRQRDAVDRALVLRYGEDWQAVVSDREYRRVRRDVTQRFDAVLGLFHHAVSAGFAVLAVRLVSPMLQDLGLALIATGNDPEALAFFSGLPPLWVLFAMLMAVFVVIHAFGLMVRLLVTGPAQDRAIEEALRHERSVAKRKVESGASAPGGVRLTEDGEFTESFVQELDEDPQKGGGAQR